MTRLIDADAMMRKAVEKFYITNYFSHIITMIDNAPTIDAVPVVRCKDCRWRDADEKHHCIDINRVFDPMDFCSFAERKDNE